MTRIARHRHSVRPFRDVATQQAWGWHTAWCIVFSALLNGLAQAQAPAAPRARPATATTTADNASDAVARAEYQLKAAFLFKFLGFVEWPPGAFATDSEPLRVGVLGSEPMLRELSAIVQTRTREGRGIAVQRWHTGGNAAAPHALFVGRGSAEHVAGLVASTKGQAVLVVTETPADAAAEGIINFVTEGDRVRFDVTLPRADQAQLKISARLLGVARRVVGPTP